MKKIVLALMGLTSLVVFATNSVASLKASDQNASGQAPQLTMAQTRLMDSTVAAAVHSATFTVSAAVVSGTIISHIG